MSRQISTETLLEETRLQLISPPDIKKGDNPDVIKQLQAVVRN